MVYSWEMVRTNDRTAARTGIRFINATIPARAMLWAGQAVKDTRQEYNTRALSHGGDLARAEDANTVHVEGLPCVVLDETDALQHLAREPDTRVGDFDAFRPLAEHDFDERHLHR
jgi:hypothetical protein